MKLQNTFNRYVIDNAKDGLVVQPRMGFSNIDLMREGLKAVQDLPFATVGTITLDAMTRQGLHAKAREMVLRGEKLNGFPLASFETDELHKLLAGFNPETFPIQVRHGTPLPQHVFEATIKAGLTVIEGGPVSYALPYGKVRLKDTFSAWQEAVEGWVDYGNENQVDVHLESFAGCMMGQLCPPSMLIAINILEALWFESLGVKSHSLSLAQGTNSDQDIAALSALRHMADSYLSKASYHIVAYTWMGVFPETHEGAELLIKESARVARIGGAERLIVKTVSEAKAIPTINDNLQALEWCFNESAKYKMGDGLGYKHQSLTDELVTESKSLVDAVLTLDSDLGQAIQKAFQQGVLDVPFCVHPDNANHARAILGPNGNIGWSIAGNIPIFQKSQNVRQLEMNSSGLLKALSFNKEKFDLHNGHHSSGL